MKNSHTGWWSAALLIGIFIFNPLVEGKFAQPEMVPTERLIQNTEAYLEENPGDARAYYTLARIHYLTFRNKVLLVHAYPNRAANNQLPTILGDQRIPRDIKNNLLMAEAKKRTGENSDWEKIQEEYKKLEEENWRPKQISTEKALKHAGEAEDYFEKATEADPENALYHLGWASLREELATYLAESNVAYPKWKGTFEVEAETTIRRYHRAYELAIDEDLKREYLPLNGLNGMVGYESAEAILRLTKSNFIFVNSPDGIDLRSIKKNSKKLEKLKRGAITPIIVSMSGSTSVNDAVTKREASFDMDGDGVKDRLDSWPNPETAILVWDPSRNGQITSGTQLFGTFGFKMIWENGYEALDALDDSRDRRLSGEELEGLALWFDQNGNAISEPGEVRPVSDLSISEIAVRSTEVVEDVLINGKGVRFENGQTAASLDWVFDLVE